jgi:hypothetical protein
MAQTLKKVCNTTLKVMPVIKTDSKSTQEEHHHDGFGHGDRHVHQGVWLRHRGDRGAQPGTWVLGGWGWGMGCFHTSQL